MNPPINAYNGSGISVSRDGIHQCGVGQTRSAQCYQPLPGIPLADPVHDSSVSGGQRIVMRADGKAHVVTDPNYTLQAGERDPTDAELERVQFFFASRLSGPTLATALVPNWTQTIQTTQTQATSGSHALTQDQFTTLVGIVVTALSLPDTPDPQSGVSLRSAYITRRIAALNLGDNKTRTAARAALEIERTATTHLGQALGGQTTPLRGSALSMAINTHLSTRASGGFRVVRGRPQSGGTGQPAYVVFSDSRGGSTCDASGIGASLPLGVTLRPDQVLTLLELGGIETGEYCMSGQRSGVVRLLSSFGSNGGATRVSHIIETLTGIKRDALRADHTIVASDITRTGEFNPYFSNAETLQIANSLRTFIQPQLTLDDTRRTQLGMQRTGLDAQLEAAGLAKFSMYFMVGLSATMLFQTYAMAKQQGWTRGLDSFLSNTRTALKASYGRLRYRDGRAVLQHWRNIFQDTSPILRDRTADLRGRQTPLTPTGRQILAGFDRGSMPHVILGGPSGSGKGHAVNTAAIAAINGSSGVQAFEGRNVRYVQISASRVVQQAGSWLNGAESIFFRTLDGLAGEHPVIVHLTEADRFSAAGMGPGNQPLNLLSRLYEIMEGKDPRYENLHFILDSTRWDEIEKAAPDLIRRTSFVETAPLRPQDVREVFDHAVRDRLQGSEGRVLRSRYERITLSDGAKDALTALGSYERGAPPSAHLTVMDAVVRDVTNGNTNTNIEVTTADVVRVVAANTKRTEAQVQSELTQLLETGIENNRRIQERIVDGFYEAYKNPRGDRINPLDVPGEHHGGYREPGKVPRADAPVDPARAGANGSGNGAASPPVPGADAPARRLQGAEGVTQEVVQTAYDAERGRRTNGNHFTMTSGAVVHLAGLFHGRQGALSDQPHALETIISRAADRSRQDGRTGSVSENDIALEFQAYEGVERFINDHQSDPAFSRLWDTTPENRGALRHRFADAYIEEVKSSGSDRLTLERSSVILTAHVQALGAGGGASVSAAPSVTPPPAAPSTPEVSVAEQLRTREAHIDQMIRDSVEGYGSLQREAKLTITESLPQLRADIMAAWRRQPALRRGLGETDLIPRDFVRDIMETRRSSHSWMETHRLTERRREETHRRGR